jgi:Fanconi anemia group M protein
VTHPLLKDDSLKLREYQESVVAVCLDQNTLVVLPTGLGKTIIALFVAAHRLYKFPGSKILFMAPTKPLAQQHFGSFKKYLNLKDEEFVLLTGEEPSINRKQLWKGARAIFATPQTIENDLIARNIDLQDVSLIVFDEAHRAVGEYAYVFIARQYDKQGRDRLSLALTASPGSTKEKINEIIENLNMQDVEIRTDKDWDVRPYVERMDVEWIKVEFPENFKRLKGLIRSAMKDYFSYVKKSGYFVGKQLDTLGKRELLEVQSMLRKEMLAGNKVWNEISDVAALLKLYHGLELLETQGIAPLDEYLKRLRKQKSKAANVMMKREDVRAAVGLASILHSQGIDHPKLLKLKEIVKDQISKKRVSKIIVFTQYRDTIQKILDIFEGEKDIAAHKLIGQAAKENEKGMSQKEQKEVLDEFNSGIFNVLIATAVGEEGLDIEEVDLVIFYEPIPSEIRSIQRRGRTARKRPGRLAVLITVGTRDELYFWSAFHKERRMHAAMKEVKREFKEKDAPGQSSLKSFIEIKEEETEMQRGIYVYVDQRERNSGIAKKLMDMGVKVDVKQLQVADFLVSERVCIEKKTVPDFLQSIIDGRLMTQVSEMCRNFQNPIVMIEGNPASLYTERNIHPNAVRGAIASIAVNFGVPIIYTTDADDTAGFLYVLAKREQEGKLKEIALRGEKRAMSLKEWQQFVVESLPNVSAVLAKRLLKHFKTVQNIFNAMSKDLQEVEGIGSKKASEIKKVIRARYEE